MRKNLFYFAFIFVFTMMNAQQSVTIGEGGTLEDDNIGFNTPITNYYGYNMSQTIYLASEINTSGQITSLQYYLNSPTISIDKGDDMIDVWMGHTDKMQFSSTVGSDGADIFDVSTLTQVVTNGSLSREDDVVTLTLDTPFDYNGTDNLIIVLNAKEAGFNGTSIFYYQFESGQPLGMNIRNDNNAYDPNNLTHNFTGSYESTSWQEKLLRPVTTINLDGDPNPEPGDDCTINSFPFTETFEDDSTSRDCWENEYVSGTLDWLYIAGSGVSVGETSANTGLLNASFWHGDWNWDTTKLVSPKLDFTGLDDMEVNFFFVNGIWGSDQSELRIYYKTSEAGEWTLIPDAEYTTSIDSWTEETVSLPESAGASEYYIAFEGKNTYSHGIGVDDVIVREGDGGGNPEPSNPCDEKTIMECGETYTTTLNPGEGEWVNYTDVTWNYTGSEKVFEFTAPTTGEYVFEVNQGDQDADFFLMDDCSNAANNLLTGGLGYWTGNNATETITLTEGVTYYLIADLYSSASSPTTVTVKVNCPDGPPPTGDDCSQEFTGDPNTGVGIISNAGADYRGANDFTVEAGMAFTLETISIDFLTDGTYDPNTVDVYLYGDSDGNGPADELESFVGLVTDLTPNGELAGFPRYTLSVTLPSPYTFEGGTDGASFWVGLTVPAPDESVVAYWVASAYTDNGTSVMYQSEDGGFAWTQVASAGDGGPLEGAMTVTGQCEQLGLSSMNSFDFAYYPNPVKDVLNINSGKTIENVSAYNLAGQSVLNSAKVTNGQINISALPTGVYVFRVTLQGGQIETFKIVKK